MPKEYRIDHFLTPTFPRTVKTYWGGMSTKGTFYGPDVSGWIDRLSGDRQDLAEICKLVTDAMRVWKRQDPGGNIHRAPQPYSAVDIASVMAACVDLDNKNLFIETFEMCPYDVPASPFKSVGSGLLRYGLESLLPK